MKIHILIVVLAFSIIAIAIQPTTLTFMVEYQDQQQQDYIELGLSVKAEGLSLVNAMNQASKIADKIKQIATEFCRAHTKKKSECKDIVEIGNYEIKPNYNIVKRQSKFMGFQVVHQVSIKVLAVDYISDLADAILKERDTKILSFEWKPLQQANSDEAAVKQGTQQGQQLCHEIDMHLDNIKNVQQVTQKDEEEAAVYKFVIQCLPGKNSLQEQQEGQQEQQQQLQIKSSKKQKKGKSKKSSKKVDIVSDEL